MADIGMCEYLRVMGIEPEPPRPRVKSDEEYMLLAQIEVEQLLAEWNGNG